MRWRTSRVALPLLLSVAICGARPETRAIGPAFTKVPELASGFHLLYTQNFAAGRERFADWESQHPDEPFGQVAVAASYLFEEFYRQDVLSSDFFLNEKKFLRGIDGQPDPERMKNFQEAVQRARKLARQRLEKDPKDPEALFALALSAGMESDADMILRKQHPDANDAYVALGAANYIIGSLSGGARFFLRFGGIHGDKTLGMQQLGKTIENGRYLQPFAKILLALAARREKQERLAQKLLHELSEEFPESGLYVAEYAKAMGRPVPSQMHP